ncbi:MAG: glycosyltransferase, partial [Phycisphaerales bacterium]
MKIGVFDNGWFKGACKALGHDPILLPVASGAGGNAYAADIAARRANGTAIVEQLRGARPDLILDNGGAGIAFVSGAGGGDVRLAHEALGIPLYSHFIDPLVTAFQGLGWPTLWQCLKSDRWVKAVWDRAQVTELLRFGVPNVIHLPMAAPDRPYDTEPLDPNHCRHAVSFVGGQNSSYFTSNTNVGTANLFAGTLALAVRSDLPGANFYDVYHDLYGLAEPVQPTDDLQTQINKTLAYYNAKLFFNASLCVRNRDRFVIFLKRKLGEKFHLIGRGWDTAYGLPVEPPLPGQDSFLNHFRETAININLVNGNAETGLNMRHFEITAAGGFMLCYDQPEIEEHFEVGKECDVFHSEAELLEKIQYYLSRPQERVEIALAGQKRTLSSHLYQNRLQAVIDHARVNCLRSLPVEFSTGKWTDECKSLLPEPDVILDCGANVGYVSEFLRRMYPKAEIFAFEPVSSVYEQLSFRAAEHG